ncbi:MAG: hypothetical protein AABY15_07155 [Nanoarchaeota archaeon]
MKQITQQEIREIAGNIINKASECPSNYDAIDGVISILNDVLKKMDITVEEVKNRPGCKCNDCACDKKEE